MKMRRMPMSRRGAPFLVFIFLAVGVYADDFVQTFNTY